MPSYLHSEISARAGRKKSKTSKGAREFIAHKMGIMKGEDRPQNQKIAIAMSEARKKGYKIPR